MKAIRMIFQLTLFGLLAACATGPRVMADSDPQADFARYHTFAFSDPLGTNRDGADTLLSQRLKVATRREMEMRGYVYDAQAPDLLLNFHAKVEEHTRASAFPMPMIAYYSYRGGFYSPWPTWNYDSYTERYRVGTLNIDLVDAARRKLVWETVVIGNAAQTSGSKAAARVDAAVMAAFRRFPVPVSGYAPNQR